MAAAVVIAGFLGLALGSFLNVVAYRLPRRESLAKPASRCPSCGHPIRPYDNIPVLSWALLRGRCRDCGVAISPRYPLVEATTGVLFAAVVLAKGDDERAIMGLLLVLLLVPVTLIDLEHQLIPNRLVAPAAVAAIAVQAAAGASKLPEHLISGAAAGLFFLLAVLAYPRGMGMGDVKLAAVLGLMLGRSVGVAVLVALLSGTVFGVGVIARKGVAAGRRTKVPFGPFLALGGMVALFAGEPLVHAYLDTFG